MSPIDSLINQISTTLSQLNFEPQQVDRYKDIFSKMSKANTLSSQPQQYANECVERIKRLSELKGTPSSQVQRELDQTINQLSLRLLSSLNKPGTIQEVDLCKAFVEQVQSLGCDDSVLEGFGQWVSRWKIPSVADVYWPPDREKLLKLAPYLTSIHLVDYKRIEPFLPLTLFLSQCVQAKKIEFFENDISPEQFDAIPKQVEEIKINFCRINEHVLFNFNSFTNLARLTIENTEYTADTLDLSNCSRLTSIDLEHLEHFKGIILLPQDAPKLKEIRIVFLEQFNQTVDVSKSAELETLEIIGCDKWEQKLLLPAYCPLRILNLEGACKFTGDLSPIQQYTELEHIDLTYCESIPGGIDFSRLTKLTFLNLRNCFSYEGKIDCSQANNLQFFDVGGSNGITYQLPPHPPPELHVL